MSTQERSRLDSPPGPCQGPKMLDPECALRPVDLPGDPCRVLSYDNGGS